MIKPPSLLLLATLAFCPSVQASVSTPAGAALLAPEVVSVEFGLFDGSKDVSPAFVPSRRVPLVPGQAYGWIIQLRTDKEKIRWKEEFTLPAKPATWGEPESRGSRAVSEEGRVSVTERVVTPAGGMIFNTWEVAPGDPSGRYVIRVIIDGVEAARFEFEVK